MIFWFIVISAPLATIIWWSQSHAIVRRGLPGRLALHLLIIAFFGSLIGTLGWIIVERAAGLAAPPLWARTLTLVWYVAALPASCMLLALAITATVLSGRARAKSTAAPKPLPAETNTAAPLAEAKPEHSDQSSLDAAGFSRRRFLATTALAAPPLMTAGFGIKSRFDQGQFRTREHIVAIENLPKELVGLTIAHLSDTHIGRYTDAAMLKRIVDATNNLRCDLIAMTGDLIDYDLSDLPQGIAMLRSLDAPGGVVICEGNHDLFVSATGFRGEMRRAGLDLLLNERITRKLRGIECEISGLRWGLPGPNGRDAQFEENFETLAEKYPALQSPSSRSPLHLHLVHHPHTFDVAGDAGIDLTLAGHTHGGQLMLADRVGPASLIYKYVSGLYTRSNESGKTVSCVVSNGTGNWLPLRMSAPAEIARITLIRA